MRWFRCVFCVSFTSVIIYFTENINYIFGYMSSNTNFSNISATAERVNDTVGSGRNEALARVEIATLSVILVLTLVGNSAVLLSLYARRLCGSRKKLTRMYYFILHLCVADIITALFNVFPQLVWEITYRFKGGPILCKLVKYVQLLGPYLSSYVLMATALDRYKAICHPLTYCSWTSHRARNMVQCAWATALIFCTPQVYFFSLMEVPNEPGVHDCWVSFAYPWVSKAYVTWYSVSVFILPLCVLIFTYWCICRELWRNAGFQITKASPHRLISRAKVNTVKQTVAVIALYIACSSPFISAQLWVVWVPDADKTPFFKGPAFTILTLLSSLNSCVNPWIYLISNQELVRSLGQILSCTWVSGEYKSNNSGNESCGASGSSGCGASGCSKRAGSTEITNTMSLLPRKSTDPPEQHIRRWVVAIPPNTTREERECLNLFSGLNANKSNPRNQQKVLKRFNSPCRAARCKLDL